MDMLNLLFGGNFNFSAAQPIIQGLFRNVEAASADIPNAFEEAAQNCLPALQNGLKDLEPLFRNLGQEVSSAAERVVSAVEAEVAAHQSPAAEEQVVCPAEMEVANVVPAEAPEQCNRVAHPATCDSCTNSIFGIRYKCLFCPDYDLCETCEASNLENHTHDKDHLFAKIYRPEQRSAAIFRRAGRCGGRGKFGGRQRMTKLETDVAQLKQQVEELLAKKAAAAIVPSQEEEEVAGVVIEDVSAEEEEVAGVVIEDVPAEEVAEEPSVIVSEEPQLELVASISPDTQKLLDLLSAMGFTDQESNLAVITAHGGNVEQALESLLNGNF